MEFDVVTEGLRFPEGPIAMADGSVILVEIERGTLTRVRPDGGQEIIAELGGGPNGAAIGPDGAVYVCNNGGFEWSEQMGFLIPGHAPHDYSGGRIERVDLKTGAVTRLYDSVDGKPLKGPNDIVFDKAGGFYFTDHGKSYPRHRDYGGLYYALPDGSMVKELAYGYTSPNGVGLSPDEKTVYMADTMTGRLWAFDLAAPGEIAPASPLQPGRVVAVMPGWTLFDSLAVTAAGTVCVATLVDAGITTLRPDGSWEKAATADLLTTTLCFGGADMRDAWITLSGTGQLIRTRWPEAGLTLAFNA